MRNEFKLHQLHVDKTSYTPIAVVKEEDNVTLNLELFKDNEPLSLTGQTITLSALRADKVIVEQTTGFLVSNTNRVSINLKNNVIAKNGIVYLELTLTDSTGSMTTLDFYLKVNRKILGNDSIQGSDNIASLEKIKQEFNRIIEEATRNENDRVRNENDRVQAELQRNENERNRQDYIENSAKPAIEKVKELNSQVEVVTGAIKIEPTWNIGKYINSSGNLVSSDSYFYSDPIHLVKGKTICVTAGGYGKNVSIISRKSINGNIPQTISVDSEIHVYKFTAEQECDIVICSNIDSYTSTMIYNNTTELFEHINNSLSDIIENVKTEYVNGKYINVNCGISTLAHYKYSQPIKLEYMETIELHGYTQSSVIALSLCDENGNNKTKIAEGSGVKGDIYRYTNSKQEAVYIIVCVNDNENSAIFKKKKFDTIAKEIKEIKKSIEKTEEEVEDKNINNNKYLIDYTPFFNNVVCIGDSLTRGYHSEYPTGQRNRDFNYPIALSRLTNWSVKNYGVSGSTPKTWFDIKGSSNFNNYDCAIICLGRNGGLASEEDRTHYKKIIDKLRNDNEHITIFTCTVPPANYSNNIEVNNYIKNIAIEKNTHFLDIYNYNLLENEEYRSDSCHFYAGGYLTLANIIKNQINKYIADNLNLFMKLWCDQTLPDIIN